MSELKSNQHVYNFRIIIKETQYLGRSGVHACGFRLCDACPRGVLSGRFCPMGFVLEGFCATPVMFVQWWPNTLIYT